MNSGFINGFSFNGAAYPQWVIRAAVVAVAAASVAVAPTRITFATAYGDAVVAVSLSPSQTIQARASTTASASVDVQPTLQYSGASTATGTATGSGAVRRDVWATAGGDATCTALALTAQAIGEASASMAASVVNANAHIVHPGRSLTPCVASGHSTGDVTRYPTMLAGYGEVVYTRGEASVKRSGHSYFNHDGYVPSASARATGSIPQDRVKIIATLGSFDFADSTGAATAFLKQPARSLAMGVNTATPATAVHIHRPTVTAQATASASVLGTRESLPSATANAGANAYAPKARINHAAQGQGSALAVMLASAKRVALGHCDALAQATQIALVPYGTQHLGAATGSAALTASASARQKHAAHAADSAGAPTATATPRLVLGARVQTAMATSLVGRAYALTNSEIKAPDDRYMTVQYEDRAMAVAAEDRTMVVTT